MPILPIPARATWPLRHRVLRQGRPLESCILQGDDAVGTFHLGLWDAGDLLGVASFMAERCDQLPADRPYRLRGMAVGPADRGRGLGAALVEEGLKQVRARHADLLWCTARTTASGFYLRLGFHVVGDVFELPGIGPHHLMHLRP